MAKTIQYFRLANKSDKNTFRTSQLKNIVIEIKVDSLKRRIRL